MIIQKWHAIQNLVINWVLWECVVARTITVHVYIGFLKLTHPNYNRNHHKITRYNASSTARLTTRPLNPRISFVPAFSNSPPFWTNLPFHEFPKHITLVAAACVGRSPGQLLSDAGGGSSLRKSTWYSGPSRVLLQKAWQHYHHFDAICLLFRKLDNRWTT